MANFVLVHGAVHGAWCWERVIPFLEAGPQVETVVAIDLVGHGNRLEEKPLDSIYIDDYVNDVVAEIESRDLHDVVLVGHSLAGITITPAAYRLEGRLRRLVYLSTTNPSVGQSVEDRMNDPLSPISREVDFETMFCNDLDKETSIWLLSRLGPEPPGPMAEKVTLATGPTGVPSSYILLEKDEALPPAYQREQARTAQVDEIVNLDAGHSAFASRPQELAELLIRVSLL
ncbi:MAG: alpha/beta fold hydrolase [Acidimicrobiia bacterium]|nr:alpha/beta fold hydrolase [Acidimicrobiia bacterium]MYG73919.1 alpha/beta fold hydrolase [Acidimicrobiia bacterium]